MKKYLLAGFVLLGFVCAMLLCLNHSLKKENERLVGNQQTLLSKVTYYQTEAGKSAASVQRLELTKSELKKSYDELCKTADDLGVQVKRIKSASTTETNTRLFIQTVVKDSLIYRDAVIDTCKVLSWKDAWVNVNGWIKGNDMELSVSSTDTLTQIVHRVPKKFLFFKFGTKAIRQSVVSSNPHTDIVYSEYIEIK